jgi:uncharacterized BrkB/YihY/UPF0761 family membrane protein
MALLRFFLIGMVELNAQINAMTGNLSVTSTLWTFCFSFFLFGQILDNIHRVKLLLVVFELIFAVWVIIMGCACFRDQAQS